MRAKQVVLATGAIERPLVFPGNDRPGVMLASAARTYLNRFAVRPGSRAVVFTNNDSAYAAALDLAHAGVAIEAIVDLRARTDGALPAAAAAAGLPIRRGSAVVGTEGRLRVSRVWVSPMQADGSRVPGEPSGLRCDCLLISGGWNPTVHLFSQSRGKLRFDGDAAAFVPDQSVQPERSAGACNGALRWPRASPRVRGPGRKPPGKRASRRRSLPYRPSASPRRSRCADLGRAEPRRPVPRQGLRRLPERRHRQGSGPGGARGLPLDRARQALHHHRHGHRPGQDQQRQRAGDRGRQARHPDRGGRHHHLPPALHAGDLRRPRRPHGGELFDPIRRTPSHDWATAQGAVFEDVGQWKRARYFPHAGEDMHAAVQRECLAVRQGVGLFDASTLGKIDIQGPDGAEFLNRVYTNAWTKLEVGRCRYGLMLRDDGMVFDDGVTARLGPAIST